LVGDDPDDEEDDDESEKAPGVNAGLNLYKLFRNIYKTFFKDRSAKYRSFIVKLGGVKASVLYRKSI